VLKLRHAAALALVGWYLMTPPVVQIILGCCVERGSSFGRETPLPQNRDHDWRVGSRATRNFFRNLRNASLLLPV
jgi:hypothetical protein